jgi:hypothetical protein
VRRENEEMRENREEKKNEIDSVSFIQVFEREGRD